MTHSKSLVKPAAALMFFGMACLVPLATAQRANAQNSMSPSTPMQSGITSSGTSVVNPSGGLVVTIDVTNPARAVSQELAVSITPASKR